MQDIIEELRKRVDGEVRFDTYSRILYSTDASIYQIQPRGVVIPKSVGDVQATVEIAYKHKIPIVPRGGGTSLVGQSIGDGIIIDFSKYMNRVLEVNREEQWARIQPGVVLDQLNSHVAADGLFFGPDVATSSRANLGGLIGNNSSGARSIVYGKTIDHVLETSVLLSDGTPAVFKAIPDELQQDEARKSGLLAAIYSSLPEIIARNRDEIEKRYPKILRRVAGYNLDAFTNSKPFDLSKLLVGSEGTLGVLTEAKVNLVPQPKERVLGVIHFHDLFSALEAVNSILEFKPSAVELIDDAIIRPTRQTMEYARRMTFVEGEPRALLLVEFQGESKAQVKTHLQKLVSALSRNKIGYAHVQAVEPWQQADVWTIRKAGLGLLLGTREARRPIGFVEDTAVAPEKLAQYIGEFDQVIREHETEACYYAHASVGLLHIRPLLNLRSRTDLQHMQSIADRVSDLVLKYGGAFSGEHGDGLARSAFNEKMFGPQLYEAFREVKRLFDPKNILNPGKIVEAQSLTENLRVSDEAPVEVSTFLDFSKEQGFFTAVEMCNGNGVCRKRDTGTMCPSFMVTDEEQHSTRGRANALRAVLSGRVDISELTSKNMYEVFELCIACKGCKGECPTNVDMAKIKYEFLYQYHQKHGLPLRDRMFGHIETLSKLGSATAPLSNWMLGTLPMRWLLQQGLAINCKRTLPHFVSQPFERWFKRRMSSAKSSGDRPKVALFHDTFMNYNYPHIGMAAVQVLEAAGYEVILTNKKCCGRPFISKGMLRQARECARHNVENLAALAEAGIPIIGCEPSCILTFREEYPDMLRDQRADFLAKNTFLMEEFILSQHKAGKLDLPLKEAQLPLLLHGHCHAKALVGIEPTVAMLKLIPQAQLEVVDSGCCGMAGSFGFEKEHYQISLAMGRRKLFEAIESGDSERQVVAAGVSCRQQIEHGTGRQAKHPVEVMAEHLQRGASVRTRP